MKTYVHQKNTCTLIPALFILTKKGIQAPAAVARLFGVSSCNQKVADLIPGQGTYLCCQFKPQSPIPNPQSSIQNPDTYRRQPINVSLSLPLSLKSNEKKCP